MGQSDEPIEPRTLTPAPLESLVGLRERDAKALRELGFETAMDLLVHAPSRYEDELAESTVEQAIQAVLLDPRAIVQLRGSVARVRTVPGRSGRIEATLECSDRSVRLVWFRAPWMARKLHPGVSGIVRGKGKLQGAYLELVNPVWEPSSETDPPRTARLKPIYPASERMPSTRIEELVSVNLQSLCQSTVDPLPASLRTSRELLELSAAYRALHQPNTRAQASEGRMRIAYGELLVLQLGIAMRRWQIHHELQAHSLPITPAIEARIRARLPFTLTPAQDKATRELAADLAATRPMNRLLQGDVGSGKTAVAVYGMLAAVAHGHQAAIIAPTEILAQQHYRTVSAMLAGTDVRVVLLSGGRSGAGKAAVRAAIAGGSAHIAIGTHALLSTGVAFHSLALAVVDEQHRFGVEQRAHLRSQGKDATTPHVLVMTATPIPRTLALAFLGDLDVSTMRGRLPGRMEIATRVLESARSSEAYAYVRRRLDGGERAYVIVPAVEESAAGLKAVGTHAQLLATGAFRGVRIGQLHGRMPPAERDEVMRQFACGECQVLVATVVVEVGIDVPEATLMVVEHAERFGLAQLHQLRGRIGRGSKPSLCVFLGDPVTDDARARLDAIATTTDGFRIGELDLSLRGPGEALGQRQSGLPPFKVADIEQDLALLEAAREDARQWIERSPRLAEPTEVPIRQILMRAYGNALGLAGVG